MAGTVWAQPVDKCDTTICFGDSGASVTSNVIVENTENASVSSASEVGDLGLSVSVDGAHIIGSGPTAENHQRSTDVDLDRVDIQVKFDGLDVRPTLNISTADLRRSYRAGETITFVATSNYPAWIDHAEILIYRKDERRELIDQLPVSLNRSASWSMPQSGREFEYVLRVYDTSDRFDETLPLTLARSAQELPAHKTSPDEAPVWAGSGEDRTAKRNIPVYGGAVTVYGRNVPQGYRVDAVGENLPIDSQQSFVIQRILPPGDHSIDVSVSGIKDGGLSFSRNVNIPANDWFYVG